MLARTQEVLFPLGHLPSTGVIPFIWQHGDKACLSATRDDYTLQRCIAVRKPKLVQRLQGQSFSHVIVLHAAAVELLAELAVTGIIHAKPIK